MENAILFYLVRSSERDIKDLTISLLQLKKFFLNKYPYKVAFFIENDFKEEWIEHIKSLYDICEFVNIEFSIPEHNNHLLSVIPKFFPHPTHSNGPDGWGHPGFSLGYRHMCRFMSGEIYKNEYLKNYDWYWRIDTDSFFLDYINDDPFKTLKDNNLIYGYNNICEDHEKVVEGLYEAGEVYMMCNGIIPKNKIEKPLMFYTNFEIANMKWFQNEGYLDLYNFIDNSGGIYLHRWGDAPIRYIGLMMLLEKEKMYDFSKDIQYKHGY